MVSREVQPHMSLLSYYTMMSAGYFQQSPNVANGFENYHERLAQGSTLPYGIVTERSWQLLTGVSHDWRKNVTDGAVHPRLTDSFRDGSLRPIVFSDVDLAILNRDAQGHVDQYVVDRSTLEALGFVAYFYHELNDRDIRLKDIQKRASQDYCFELGQSLFHTSLKKIQSRSDLHIPTNRVHDFAELLEKSSDDLNDDDFRDALSYVEDSMYQMIINPIADYISHSSNHELASRDSQAGVDRMVLVYTTIAAISHSWMADSEKVRQKFFGDFNARDHLFPGVEQMFHVLRDADVEVVGITRGNQFPYMEGSPSGMRDLFSRVYSTMIASTRSEAYLDPLHPDKKIRSYSLNIDSMSTTDKVRIMMHEVMQKFTRAGFSFDNEQQLINSTAVFLDKCLFITDADLEVWGTCPTMAVLALRTPTSSDVREKFRELPAAPMPVAVINPTDRPDVLFGLDQDDIFHDFNPEQKGIQELIRDLACARDLKPVYSRLGLRR